VLDIFVRL